jgi:hypothetical protein
VADGWWSRFRGWQGRPAVADDEGLLLVPCRSVHTHWMRFPVDIVFLNAAGEVLDVRRDVRPWRFVLSRGRAHAVLELPAGRAAVNPGDRVRMVAAPGGVARASLSFLSVVPGTNPSVLAGKEPHHVTLA